jgi:hypothetical protein
MGLKDWADRARVKIIESLGGSALGGFGAYGGGDDKELDGFRRITDRAKTRDLDILSHARMVRLAHYLYASNPMARWLVDQPVSMIVSPELDFTVDVVPDLAGVPQEKAKELEREIRRNLLRFWQHPTHNLQGRALEYATTYLVSGSLLMPIASENAVDGVPQLDLVDAEQITGVRPLKGSSLNPEFVSVAGLGGNTSSVPVEVVRADGDGRFSGASDPAKPRAFYFRFSLVVNSLLGRSYLMDVADWLDGQDQFLFSGLDRGKLRNNHVWDLEIQGANAQDAKDQAKLLAQSLAGPGGIYAHNEKIKLEAQTPNLGAAETADFAKLYRTHVLGSKSMPESWYGSGGSSKATAGDQTDVTYKTLQGLQSRIRPVFETPLQYAYDRLQTLQEGAGFPIRSGGAVKISVNMPPITERDAARVGAVIQNVESALELAVAAEFVSRSTARRVFLAAISKLGVDANPDEERQQIALERERRDAGLDPVLPVNLPNPLPKPRPAPGDPGADVTGAAAAA